jgi:ABC-type uncharacterized transport system YnjBCD substrate-binding protein
LAAVPAHIAAVAAWMLGTSHLLSREHQQLLDEALGDLPQQVLDGQLGLSQHAQQRQGVFWLTDKGQNVLCGLRLGDDAGFLCRLFRGG